MLDKLLEYKKGNYSVQEIHSPVFWMIWDDLLSQKGINFFWDEQFNLFNDS
jgi:hypothetical protein